MLFRSAADFDKRVTLDSGLIRDRKALTNTYTDALNLLPNTLLAYSPEMGVKQSVSGLVYKATKLYDMSQNNNDGSQATAANQPYIGGNIAPNERMWLWGNLKVIKHIPISMANGAKWTVSWVGDIVKSDVLYVGVSQGYIYLTPTTMVFSNTSGSTLTLAYSQNVIGRVSRQMIVCRGLGEIEYWADGVLRNKGSIADTSIIFEDLYTSQKLKSLRILNKDLSKSEIEGLDKFLASIYPDHETTAIVIVTGKQIGRAHV